MNDSLVLIADQAKDTIIKQTSGTFVEQTTTPFFSSPFFTIMALVLSIVCMALVVLLFLYCRKQRRTDNEIKNLILDSLHKKDGNISQAVIELVLEDAELMRRFSKQGQNSTSVATKDVEKTVQREVERILIEKQIIKNDYTISPDPVRPTEPEEVQSNPLVRYASTVDEDKNCFYEVTKIAKNDTIFVLELNREDENEATFSVFDKAYKKVIQEQGHLKGGCTIVNPDMNHTTMVETVEPGLARYEDGVWVIKNKATVKFV
jgi:hypothetical protein